MKGFILAAGLGSRLKPWTDHHPKALAPVGGVPMFQRVIEKMFASGISDITVNVYHFADQVLDFIKSKGWKINISDERPELLETGGALLHAEKYLQGEEPILVHNADILSNIDLLEIIKYHNLNDTDATLLVSERESTRKLIFSNDMRLRGWHSLKEDKYRPEGFSLTDNDVQLAFSGIYVVSADIFRKMKENGWNGRFSIMDYFIETLEENKFMGYFAPNLNLIDIGKPDSLNRANKMFK